MNGRASSRQRRSRTGSRGAYAHASSLLRREYRGTVSPSARARAGVASRTASQRHRRRALFSTLSRPASLKLHLSSFAACYLRLSLAPAWQRHRNGTGSAPYFQLAGRAPRSGDLRSSESRAIFDALQRPLRSGRASRYFHPASRAICVSDYIDLGLFEDFLGLLLGIYVSLSVVSRST